MEKEDENEIIVRPQQRLELRYGSNRNKKLEDHWVETAAGRY